MTGFQNMAPVVAAIPGVLVSCGEPMARHTSLRVGGPVDLMVRVGNEAAMVAVLDRLAQEGCPWVALGAGTNLLVTDEGLDGAAIRLVGDLERVALAEGPMVEAGAGVGVGRVLKVIEDASLAGLEFLTGIPGTIGGAVAMNAGTRYGYVNSRLIEARLASRDGAEWVPADRLGLSYRHSEMAPGSVVCAARFRLQAGRGEEARRIVEDLELTRRLRHPPAAGTAGSFFKNPDPARGLFAGKMIEAAGLKGTCVGGAVVSPIHANFLTNAGNATARDLLMLAAKVREEVLSRTGVALELEVRVVGRGAGDYLAMLGGDHVLGA